MLSILHHSFIIRTSLCSRRLFLRGALPLAEADGLADAIAQIVQLRTSCNAAALDVNFGNLRRMQRELSLDALAGNDAADREHLAAAATRTTNDRAAENL